MATGTAGMPPGESASQSLGGASNSPGQNRVSWSAARAMGQNNLAARPASEMPETESARLLARFKQTALLKQKADASVGDLGDASGQTLEQKSVRAFRSLAALQEKVNAKEREDAALLHQEMRAAGVYTAMRMEYDQLLKMKQADAAGHQSALLQLRQDMAAQRQLIASLQQRLQSSESLVLPSREGLPAIHAVGDVGGIIELVSRTRRQEVEIARLQRQVAAFHDLVGLSSSGGESAVQSSVPGNLFLSSTGGDVGDSSLGAEGVNNLANSAMVLRVRLHASQEALEDKDRQVKELAEELGAARATAAELESRVARLVADRSESNASLSRLQAQWASDHERVRKVLQEQIAALEAQVAASAASEQRARRTAAKEREMAKLQGAVATCISKELGETQRLLLQGGKGGPAGNRQAGVGDTSSPSRPRGLMGGEYGDEILGMDASFGVDGSDEVGGDRGGMVGGGGERGMVVAGGGTRGSSGTTQGEVDRWRARARAAEARLKEAEATIEVSRERNAAVLAELHKDLAARDGRIGELQKALQKAVAEREREAEAGASSKSALREVEALRREADALRREIKGKDARLGEMDGLRSILRIKDAQIKELEASKGQARDGQAGKGQGKEGEALRATEDALRAENEALRAQLRANGGAQGGGVQGGVLGVGTVGLQGGSAERERERGAGAGVREGSKIPLPDVSVRASSRDAAREMEEELMRLKEASFEKDAELRLAREALAAEKGRTSRLGGQVETTEARVRELEASVRQLTQAAKETEAELLTLREVRDRAWLLEEEVRALEGARGKGGRVGRGRG
eukprot:jgi/Mesvir1/17070/Mv15257-RA.1